MGMHTMSLIRAFFRLFAHVQQGVTPFLPLLPYDCRVNPKYDSGKKTVDLSPIELTTGAVPRLRFIGAAL